MPLTGPIAGVYANTGKTSATVTPGLVIASVTVSPGAYAVAFGGYLSGNAAQPADYDNMALQSDSTVASTTVAAGSNGGEISLVGSWAFPSAGVLSVASTAGFPTAGAFTVAASGPTTATVTYSGITGTTLTGCQYVSGSATGTVATGGAVTLTFTTAQILLVQPTINLATVLSHLPVYATSTIQVVGIAPGTASVIYHASISAVYPGPVGSLN